MTAPKMPPLTDREMRMLLALIEAEETEARLLLAKWESATDAEAEGVTDLEYQRAYFTGMRTGVSSVKALIEGVLNA